MEAQRSHLVELRRYALHPGTREVLIDLFEREFVETQEAVGMRVIGQFRDLDDPDSFVWLRGFPDMPARARSLTAFYDGPVWLAHRDAANATMIDSDNVLLLRPSDPTSGFPRERGDRPAPGAVDLPGGLIVATIYHLDGSARVDFPDFFERMLAPDLTAAGASILAHFVSETSPNNFPRLPVREGEHCFVWFSRFADVETYDRYVAALAKSARWSGAHSEALARQLAAPPEAWRLTPTARSLLHG